MQIIIIDGYALNPGDLSWDFMAKLGEYKVYKQTNYEQIIERCRDADIVVSNKVLFDEHIIASLPNLKFITITATGYNHIDIHAAQKHNIQVSNVPNYSTQSVAQTVMAHLLELAYHIGHHSQTVLEGRWSNSGDFCYWDRPLMELSGKKMGIIGYGSIGQETAKLAKAFGMEILVYKHKENMLNDDVELVSMDELCKQSDVITLHCPLTKNNIELIDKEKLELMKHHAFLINTARGGLINESDLAEALNNGRIAGAGLDVLSSEPPSLDNPLLKAKNCYITPHIAWASVEARKRMMKFTSENINAFISGTPHNLVN